MEKILIDNWNHVDTENIIADDKGRYFAILRKSGNGNGTCDLRLLQFNEKFTVWDVTIGVASNENHEYISVNDEEFIFKFYVTGYKKSEMSALITNHMNPKTSNPDTQDDLPF